MGLALSVTGETLRRWLANCESAGLSSWTPLQGPGHWSLRSAAIWTVL